jgi:hypothetical protein
MEVLPMNHPSPIAPWLFLGLGLYLAWALSAGLRKGRLRISGRYGGGFTVIRKHEPGPFWIYAIYGFLFCLLAVYVGLKGVMGSSFPFPGTHPSAKYYILAVLGIFSAALFIAYLKGGYVPSVGKPITRADRPINYYITIALLGGLGCAGLYFGLQGALHFGDL